MAELAPFLNPPGQAAQLAWLTQRLFTVSEQAVDGLSIEQFNDTFGEKTNSVGFDVWHIVRTVDNIIHFVFEREQPIWLQQRFDEQWNLPKVVQGTGQPSVDAFALRFPEPEEFKRYIRAVAAAVVPRIEAMPDEYLAGEVTIRPWGEVRRSEAIGWGFISHGNGHLGRVGLARTLWALPGLPF
jgi:hypothetical protein